MMFCEVIFFILSSIKKVTVKNKANNARDTTIEVKFE